ncbi:MAG: helix-turn-helix domain-containing protein [Lachnospiraceae bacterium]
MAKTMAIPDQCPMDIGLNILSGKWTLRILWHVSRGPIRFNELQRRLGAITTKTLTTQLRQLEEQGVMTRTVYPETPPKVEYALTELGQSIQPILKGLCDWGTKYQNAISQSITASE